MSHQPLGPRVVRFLREPTTTYERWAFRRRERISPRDTMFTWEGTAHYFAVGESALACVLASLQAAGADVESVRRVLDFGCGHGRVLRRLAAAFPDAAFTVSDQDASGVDFCAQTFGATAIYSSPDPAAVSLAGPYDLIWVGSVFTHLDADAFRAWLAVLAGALAQDGVLVITTHGARAADLVRDGSVDFSDFTADRQDLLERWDRAGFAFAAYRSTARNDVPDTSPYGNSYIAAEVTRSWLADAGLAEVAYLPAGWDNHQDVYGCVRAPTHRSNPGGERPGALVG
jgi:SAM-dependent methyltransferase